MHILKFLGLLETLESTMSELYVTFARSFGNDPDAALFFDQMSMEESLHVILVKFQRRVATANLKACRDIDFDAREVEETIEKTMSVIKTGARLSLEEALKMSLDIENGMAEQHSHSAIQHSLPDIVKLMNNLTAYDCRHFDAFLSFAEKRGFHFNIHRNAHIPVCSSTEAVEINPPHSAENASVVSRELVERIEYLYEWQDKMDYYKVLGVRETASPNEIRQEFHRLAKELHPDMHINLPPKLFEKLNSIFSRIALAHSILMNEGERLKYNKSLPSRHH